MKLAAGELLSRPETPPALQPPPEGPEELKPDRNPHVIFSLVRSRFSFTPVGMDRSQIKEQLVI